MGINTWNSFKTVINLVKKNIAQFGADLLLCTGDLSNDESTASYQHIKETFTNRTTPMTWTAGNHDDMAVASQILGDPLKKIELANWQLIILNSQWHNHIAGFLPSSELEFLEQALTTGKNKFTLICLHHHVTPLRSSWLDEYILHNNQDFLNIVNKYDKTKLIVCGHAHQDNLTVINAKNFITTPSTCFQFKPQTDELTLDELMPGYRWINLYSNGNYATGVIRVACDQNLLPNTSSKGY
jgi:Icc protein